jgi:hypothetical protein
VIIPETGVPGVTSVSAAQKAAVTTATSSQIVSTPPDRSAQSVPGGQRSSAGRQVAPGESRSIQSSWTPTSPLATAPPPSDEPSTTR